MQALQFIEQCNKRFLMQMRDTTKQVKQFNDISVVKEYLEIFIDDLPGLPLERRLISPLI